MLVVDKINKSYRNGLIDNHVLANLDFNLDEGEIVAIRGASGSGKSTLLNILGLLDSPDRGNLIVDGLNITSLDKIESTRAKSIGFLFQFHHLLTEFTVLENLLIPLMLDKSTNKTDNLMI